MASTLPYPAERETDVVLRDGSTLHVRPVRPDDGPGLLAFYSALSDEARLMRFFSPLSDVALVQQVRRDVAVDHMRRFGLVGTHGPRQEIVAEASYAVGDGDHAEVAFAVADAYQGRGIATILLGQLAEIAAAHGIHVFQALVLPDNQRMIEVFREAGFPVDVHFSGWEILVTFPTSFTEGALARFEQRDQIAAVNALRAFFAPRSVAVIGASRRRGTIGGEVFHNLLRDGFEGPVYPVNPAAAVVQSVPAYHAIGDVPGPIDLAVVTVPAAEVAGVATQCAEKGVRALAVITAGFGEAGEEGRARQAELVRICRTSGMRLIGPNCMGLLNTDPAVRLNATFAPQMPPAGRVAFSTQSGALGLAIIDYAASLGLGLSTFVSVGNKADISGNDLLNYWDTDPGTDVILLYLESFGNPRRFARIARRVGRTKPIVAVKSGRSPAGTRATSSHTGALVAADVTVDALFRQAGVIRTDTLEELFDVAALLANQPVPAGNQVAVVTNGGGAGVLCADACEAQGLVLPEFGEETLARLRGILPAEASVRNPVDMLAAASADQYRQTVQIVAADPQVDAVIVIFVPPLVTEAADVARALVDAARDIERRKPILTVFMSTRGVPEALRAPDVRLPSYAFPEAAAIALARAACYSAWRARPLVAPPALADVRRGDAAMVISGALARGGGWLAPDEADALLRCYGLPVAAQRLAPTPAEAASAADALTHETGVPAVALKAVGPDLLHKTDVGAIRLGLAGAEAVHTAADEMLRTLAAAGHHAAGWLVQSMASPGIEMIVGVVHDPRFGPVLACGAGGTLVEVLRDVAVRLTPLTERDAREMVQGLKIAPALAGVRGRPPADVTALINVLLRVAALVEDLPQVAELDCNPVIVHEHGATIVDVRVRVAPVDLPPLLGRPQPDAPGAATGPGTTSSCPSAP
ncbi:MAG TPA: GNAT family N-acetyltransferase [bacterium]|nr:GNAT family N-acetyltransferase [bacterium]